MFDKSILNLYLVAGTQDCTHRTEPTPQERLLTVLEQALQAGISCYQFREKGKNCLTNPHEIKALAYECQALCRQYGVPFVMNNDVELCLAMGADGVHIGQSDKAVREVVALCRGRAFVGLSHSSLAEIDKSLANNLADYWAIGPIFPTISKADAKEAVGVAMVGQVRQRIGERPLVAIGGIDEITAHAIKEQGADGIACVSAITRAKDIEAVVRAMLAC